MGLTVRPARSNRSLPEELGSLLQAMFCMSMNAIIRFGDTAIYSRDNLRRYEISHIILDFLDTLELIRSRSYSRIVTMDSYPISHWPRDIATTHDFCALPLESEAWIEDFPIPVGHVGKFINESYHGKFSNDITVLPNPAVS